MTRALQILLSRWQKALLVNPHYTPPLDALQQTFDAMLCLDQKEILELARQDVSHVTGTTQVLLIATMLRFMA